MEIRGGTLSGSGFLRLLPGTPKQVLAETGGTVAPGSSIDTLQIDGDVVFGDGGIFAVEINGAGDADLLSIIQGQSQSALGDIDLSSASDFLEVTNLAGDSNGIQFVVVEYAGSRIGMFDNVPAGVSVNGYVSKHAAETLGFRQPWQARLGAAVLPWDPLSSKLRRLLVMLKMGLADDNLRITDSQLPATGWAGVAHFCDADRCARFDCECY